MSMRRDHRGVCRDVRARRAAGELRLLLSYVDRHTARRALRLPWWRYVAALTWVGRHAGGPPLTRRRACGLLRALVVRARRRNGGGLPAVAAITHAVRILRTLHPAARIASSPSAPWVALPRPAGGAVVLSLRDLWIGLLWRRHGGSWTTLDARLAETPGAGAVRAAARRLRTRLRRARHVAPPPALTRAGVDDAVDALRWLAAGAMPARRPERGDPALAALSTADVVARLGEGAPRMPRRAMEELLRRHAPPAALAAVIDAAAPPRPNAAALWAIVVLGERRAPESVASLVRFLEHPTPAAVAAAEALGKIGGAAIPALGALLDGSRTQRVFACGALATIGTPAAWRLLARSAGRHPGDRDVVVGAMARCAGRRAIPRLMRHRPRMTGPARHDLDLRIRRLLVAAPSAPAPVMNDWRVRYRPLPRLGWTFSPGWPWVAALPGGPPNASAPPSPPPGALDEWCRRCGGAYWQPSGVVLCRHTAPATVRLQATLVGTWISIGVSDVWTALDGCDAADVSRTVAADTTALDVVALGRATVYWMVDRRLEALPDGLRHLTRLVADLDALGGRRGATPRRPTAPHSFLNRTRRNH